MNSYSISQLALQLYTLRDFCKTLPDLTTTLEKVRGIGYRAVQVSGVGVAYPEVKKAADAAGLTICATHESSDLILNNPAAVSERLNILGCKHTAYPWPGGIDFAKEDVVRDFARRLGTAGAVLAKQGHTLSYHNHANEFVRFGETTVLDYLFGATDPAYLKAELDTYWVQFGGGDPTAWIEKLKGRAPLLHLKDYMITAENKPTFCEIGQGNLDWKKILTAAHASGTEWLIVEQDSCPADPFDSVKQSFDYLAKMLGA